MERARRLLARPGAWLGVEGAGYGLRLSELIAAGLILFVITLVVNMIARAIIAKHKEFSGANG